MSVPAIKVREPSKMLNDNNVACRGYAFSRVKKFRTAAICSGVFRFKTRPLETFSDPSIRREFKFVLSPRKSRINNTFTYICVYERIGTELEFVAFGLGSSEG